jgi:hypothetical protein
MGKFDPMEFQEKPNPGRSNQHRLTVLVDVKITISTNLSAKSPAQFCLYRIRRKICSNFEMKLFSKTPNPRR